MTELAIGQRLDRKRLRGFDYHAASAAPRPDEAPAKKDWRKRTREIETKQTNKKVVKPNTKPPGRRSKPA
jgi:hypothetical protein